MGRGEQQIDDVVRVGFDDAWTGLDARERLGSALAELKQLLFSAGPKQAEEIATAVSALYQDSCFVDPLTLQNAEEVFDLLIGYHLCEQGQQSKRGSAAFLPQLFFTLRAEDGFSPYFVRANPEGLALRCHARETPDATTTVCGKEIDPATWTLRGKRGTFTDRNAICKDCEARLQAAQLNDPDLKRALAEFYTYDSYFKQEAAAINAAARVAASDLIRECQEKGLDALAASNEEQAALLFEEELVKLMKAAAIRKGCQLAAERLHERDIPERAQFFFAAQLYSSLTDSPLGPELLDGIQNKQLGRGISLWPVREIVAECFEHAVGQSVSKGISSVWNEPALVELRSMLAVAAHRWPAVVEQLYCDGKLSPPQIDFLEKTFGELIPMARRRLSSGAK